MPARIRLQRFGRKKRPFFHIVIADSRAPRDGKFIEKIGSYNSLTIPATIDLDFDKAIEWLNKGAKPSDTVRAILSYKGVLYKNHLNKGIKKGALTQEQAEAKFKKWLIEKESKINSVTSENKLKIEDIEKKRLEAEKMVNEQRSSAIAKKIEKEEIKAKTEDESKEQQQEPVKSEDIKAEKQEPVKTEDIKTEAPKQETDKKPEQPKAEKQKPAKTEDIKAETAKQETDKKPEQPKAEKQKPAKTENIKTEAPKQKDNKKTKQPKAKKSK